MKGLKEVTFYMKSGNVIRQKGFEKFTFSYYTDRDGIARVEWKYSENFTGDKLNLKSLHLDQIEAISELEY